MRVDIKQLNFIDKTLREIVLYIEEQTGVEFTATSLFRMNDTGVHGALPLRGIDLRMRSKAIGREIEKIINERWSYDYKRTDMMCAVLHGEGSNLHIHLQVHPHTKRRDYFE